MGRGKNESLDLFGSCGQMILWPGRLNKETAWHEQLLRVSPKACHVLTLLRLVCWVPGFLWSICCCMFKFGVLSFMLPSSHRTLSWTEVHEVWKANVVRALGNEVVRICWLTGRLWSKPTHFLDDSVLHFLALVILYFIVFLIHGNRGA